MDKNILVCITQQKVCERLIDHGKSMADTEGSKLFVLHVIKNDWKYAAEDNSLQDLFEIAANAGAELTVLKAESIENTIALFASRNKITDIVMGESLEYERQQNMIDRVQNKTSRKYRFSVVPIHQGSVLERNSSLRDHIHSLT